MRLGLVLGAGGTAGVAFHSGVVRAMKDIGLDPGSADVMVGTSAGSIVAALLRGRAPASAESLTVAAEADADSDAAAAGRLFDRVSALQYVRRPRSAVNALWVRPDLMRGRIPTRIIANGLRQLEGQPWPSSPLWVVAARRDNARRVVFGQQDQPATDLTSAVTASCAIPGYFTPVEINGVSYVDGGVHSHTNADLLAPCPLDLVVVSAPMSVDARAIRNPRADLAARLFFRVALREEMWTLARPGLRVVAIEPDLPVLRAMGLNMLSDRRIAEIEALAYDLATRNLAGVPAPSGPRRS